MNRFLVYFVLIAVTFCSSCIPYKDTIYLQDKNGGEINDSLPNIVEQQKPYRIQIDDILNIRVKALDQATVRILNPFGDNNLNASN
ncbi:MAG: sugar transporter, partial [Winogradskyella sp.]|nr:sugar transporter [Winogradskyella sp.]